MPYHSSEGWPLCALVPYRQFVISFPIPLRYWLNANKKLYAKVHRIVIEQIQGYYVFKAASIGMSNSAPGSISFTQRWGSAANLNPHMHVLCPDGVFVMVGGRPRFRNIGAIADNEVARLVEQISLKARKYLQKKGYLNNDGEVVENPIADDIFRDSETVSMASSESITMKIAFGPNAGRYVTRIGSGFGYLEEIPLAKGKRCFSIHGFSLHANTATNTHQRQRLEELIEYIARGPLSNERLEITDSGHVKLRLKSRWQDGTSHLLFTPLEFIEKLVALIPPPKTNLVRWSGVFAPNSPYRKLITLNPEVKKGFEFDNAGDCGEGKAIRKNFSWSKMLARVFKVDVMTCEHCGSKLRKVAAVVDPVSITRFLTHQRLAPNPPPRGPPGFTQTGSMTGKRKHGDLSMRECFLLPKNRDMRKKMNLTAKSVPNRKHRRPQIRMRAQFLPKTAIPQPRFLRSNGR